MLRIMPNKSTRAFRTISEAGDELDLQPHVLRFWESKFPQIQPMKRSGGRRFYRPEDIEFLRGIKILLHREKHPIKDVQKLIRVRGAQSIVELGRAREQAANPKDIKDTNLVPKRIKPVVHKPEPAPVAPVPERVVPEKTVSARPVSPKPVENVKSDPEHNKPVGSSGVDREKLETALGRLRALKSRWEAFK
ncbi:MAG: hypothetical protein COA69_05105 [Robiginitomaculum sp.]|nr:MAG: hypothetical protein COA69_05105 [Robiginitomaculum sp.]